MMYSNTKYFENMHMQKGFALKKHHKSEEDLRDSIDVIKKWLRTQPHLPEMPNDVLIGNFLFMNKFSIESTKQRLDMYYTKQSLMSDFFENNHPDHPSMQELYKTVYFFPTPRSTDEGHRITVCQLSNTDPENFNANCFFVHFFNTFEIRLHEDHFAGEILIFNFQNISFQHIVKMSPTLIKKSTTILEKVFNNSVHQIHIVNHPPFADSLIKLMKKLMKPKLANRIHLHQSMDKIADFVPSKYLPKEFGGEERSLEELNDMWMLKMADYKGRFDVLNNLRVIEEKRPTPLINDDLLGFYGNFKTLNVD